jgi:hypothetical protein
LLKRAQLFNARSRRTSCILESARVYRKSDEEAAGRNAYSVARFTSAYYGCMLEAGGAFNATSTFVLRELSSDVWTGGIKDWPKRRVIGVCDRVGDHTHGRKVELEALRSERDLRLARRVQAMCYTGECSMRFPNPSTRADMITHFN